MVYPNFTTRIYNIDCCGEIALYSFFCKPRKVKLNQQF